jgi:hypothetical protein
LSGLQKKSPPDKPEGHWWFACREYYFVAGVAAGIVEVGADAGVVGVTADCSAGFGASCFWHPAKAKTAATASTAIITLIFFTLFHPLSSHENNRSALVAIG